MSEIEDLRRSVENIEKKFLQVEERIKKMREKVRDQFKELLDKHQASQIDPEFLEDFIKEPWVMIPKKGHEWYVLVPKFIKMSVGYLDHSTKSYNVFIVNKYVRWLSMRVFYISWGRQKRRLAAKLNNPRIANITLCSLRHLKGTTEYHRTRDILHVKRLLGHQSINTTLIYIDLDHAIFRTKNDQFTVRVAERVDEACQLIEVGFEYVTGDYMDGGKIFRKRK